MRPAAFFRRLVGDNGAMRDGGRPQARDAAEGGSYRGGRSGRIAEVDGNKAFAAIDKAAASAAFSPKGAVVEVWGVCADCAEAAA